MQVDAKLTSLRAAGAFGLLPSDLLHKILTLVAGSQGVLLLGLTTVCKLFRDEAHQVWLLTAMLPSRTVAETFKSLIFVF